jgi:hypothetical protein
MAPASHHRESMAQWKAIPHFSLDNSDLPGPENRRSQRPTVEGLSDAFIKPSGHESINWLKGAPGRALASGS